MGREKGCKRSMRSDCQSQPFLQCGSETASGEIGAAIESAKLSVASHKAPAALGANAAGNLPLRPVAARFDVGFVAVLLRHRL